MRAHLLSVASFTMVILANVPFAMAHEPTRFHEFFDKGQLVHVYAPSNSDLKSAKILTAENLQQISDSQSLSADELVKKYPELQAKLDDSLKRATADWPAFIKQYGYKNPDQYKPKPQFSYALPGAKYRVIKSQPEFLLVEDIADATRKRVLALQHFSAIGWFSGLTLRIVPEKVESSE